MFFNIYFKHLKREAEKETQRKLLHLLVHSTDSHNGQGERKEPGMSPMWEGNAKYLFIVVF